MKPNELDSATRFVAQYSAFPDTDRRWFPESPPPLSNRTKPTQEDEDRYHDFERRDLHMLQAQYIWNRKYAEHERRIPHGIFKGYPETVMAFDPPGGASIRPTDSPSRAHFPRDWSPTGSG